VPTGDKRAVAVVLSLAAALAWATYYVFVLWASPAARPSAVLVYPFLFGGVLYVAWAVARGAGRDVLRLFRSARAYLRIALLVGMQLSVLAATYQTGPVDASLLSLIGDVVVTPVIVAFALGIDRRHVASPRFLAGLLLSLAGGTLAIVGGRSLAAIPPAGWLVVPAVPLTVAFYFILSARAAEAVPMSAVVGQSMLTAGLVTAALAPLVPGGWGGLVTVPLRPLLLLALCGVSSFFVAPAVYFLAIEKVGLILPPMLMTGIPVFTLLLSATLLGIAPPWVAVLGVPLAVVGGVLALRGEQAQPRPSPAPR
jgi:drug/metabolite transporter (DMT)-like permease